MRGRLIRLLMLVMLLPGVASAQTHVAFDGIALGRTVKVISAELRAKGFRPVGKPQTEDQLFYGTCRKGFFLGTFHGEPACVALTESGKTGDVFCMDVQLRKFIDAEEAIERLNPIIAEDAGCYPHFSRGKDRPQAMAGMVEMADAKGYVTKYVVNQEATCLLYFYEDVEEKMYIGSISYQVCETLLGGEHIIDIRYYDARSGRAAE